MIIALSKLFIKKLNKLTRKRADLTEHFTKQFLLLKSDNTNNGLKLHKLQGNRSEQYAIWITGDIRAVALKDGNTLIFFISLRMMSIK
jgi:mRNA-degrading endonuclease YafQ of YafQ-DinJ toxin-antitoxin module